MAYNAQILLFVSTPFYIYFIAEELKVSGIIAVVCAGLMQNSESIRSRFITPRQFHNGLVLLRLLRELLNNTIFVILGLLVVRIIRDDLIIGNTNSQWIVIGILLYITNLLVRYLYGLLSKMGNKGSIIFALGGVHGAVTLALVYMIINNVNYRIKMNINDNDKVPQTVRRGNKIISNFIKNLKFYPPHKWHNV